MHTLQPRTLLATACALLLIGGRTTLASPQWLVRIPWEGDPADIAVPVYAHLQDALGGVHVLSRADPRTLEITGYEFDLLDEHAEGATYWLAYPFAPEARERAAGRFDVIADAGTYWLIRARHPREAEELAELGFEVAPLPDQPLVFESRRQRRVPRTLIETAHPAIAEMILSITTNRLVSLLDELTGPAPTIADRIYTNIPTRHTTSGRPIRRAAASAYEFFCALGLDPTEHVWTASGYSNRNIIASRPGVTASSEIVVVCAHLDDMPSGPVAPGADDNASGSAAVLLAADALRDYAFERTIRFCLFTGEEQGLLGSKAYAEAVASTGEDVVAVVNLDMIGWDGDGDGVVQLHTRLTNNPGYPADRAIAAAFTNVVRLYGLTNVVPELRPTGLWVSDHSPFWNHGYPAILAIEEYGSDFNPYYHTTNDRAAFINFPYFLGITRAAAATIAHLARPVEPTPFHGVRVVSGPFLTDSVVEHGTFVARHQENASEGDDPLDVPTTTYSFLFPPHGLALLSKPGETNLGIDARSEDSETIFEILLLSQQTNDFLATTNRLRFDFIGRADPDAVYLVRVTVTNGYLEGGSDFACVTNLRDVIANGGFLDLPAKVAVTNGAQYGACEIRRLSVARQPTLELETWSPTGVVLWVEGPPGIRAVDAVESALTPGEWTDHLVLTNESAITDATFYSGEAPLRLTSLPVSEESPGLLLRLRRRWLSPEP